MKHLDIKVFIQLTSNEKKVLLYEICIYIYEEREREKERRNVRKDEKEKDLGL